MKTIRNPGSTVPAPAARHHFCGPSPTKMEPSGCCLPCPIWLPYWRKSLVKWAASIHAKYGEKYGKKLPKNSEN